MGAHGNIPKRSDQPRLGHSHGKNEFDDIRKVQVSSRKPAWPKASENWDDNARRWYNSLRRSGQSEFYEPSDIETAYFVATQMSDFLLGTYRTARGEMLRAIQTGMSLLLNTEADRRRAGVELVRGDDNAVDPAVTAMDKYKKMLAKQSPIEAC